MVDVKFKTQEMLVRQLALDSFWAVKIFTYDESGNLTYLACNTVLSAGLDATTWYIWKYTWDESGNCTQIEGPLQGTQEGQASLSWRA